jgi:hypothetical protein
VWRSVEECGGVWRRSEEDCGGVRRNEEEQWRHSLTYVIIICNDVTRTCSNTIRRNLLTTHFLASLHVCDTIVRAIYKRICGVWSFISTAIAFCCYCQLISII